MIDILIFLVILLVVLVIVALVVKAIARMFNIPPEITQAVLLVLGAVFLIALLMEIRPLIHSLR